MTVIIDGTAGITFPNSTTQAVAGAPLTTPSFTTTIGVGAATASASGAGITFPATQSASSDANTLDDYEEGTWTPAYAFATSGSVTQTITSGRYTKIGNIVSASCRIATSAISSPSGDTSITGLPFSSASGSNYGVAIGQVSSFATSGLILRGQVEPSVTSISLLKNDTNSGAVTLQGNNFTSGNNSNLIDLTVTYRTT